METTQTCVVTHTDGTLIGVAESAIPSCFPACSSQVELSDEAAHLRPLPVPIRRHSYMRTMQPLGRRLSPKYQLCENVADLSAEQQDYVADLTSGIWLYSLDSLRNGDGAFMSVVSMRYFLADLPKLQSGKNMFAGCSLSLCSVKNIARSVPRVEKGVLTLGIDIRLKNSSVLVEALSLLESKGWTLEVQYNTPSGVPTLAELDYLEHPASADNMYPAYFALPLPNVTSPYDSFIYETEHMFLEALSVKEGEGCPLDNGCFLLCNGTSQSGTYVVIDGVLNNPNRPNTSHIDWVFPILSTPNEWCKIRQEIGDVSKPLLAVYVNDQLLIEQALQFGVQLAARKKIYVCGYPSQSGANSHYTFRVLRGKKRSAKIWSNGKLLYDLIPVLDETGEACLFDKVSQQYFYNEGEGKFGWALKPAVMRLRSTVPSSLVLPRSPIWARVSDNQLEWCHYVSHTDGWQQFASIEEAQENLGINSPM